MVDYETANNFDKIWNSHVIKKYENGDCLIYIDRHLVHEVASPQAFEGLKNKRKVRQPQLTLAVPDHNVWLLIEKEIVDVESKVQVGTLIKN